MEDQNSSKTFSYSSMGTTWKITIWDYISEERVHILESEIFRQSEEFARLYSRFISTSLVWQLSQKTGMVEVPKDLVVMLRLYRTLYAPSMQKLNPLIGYTLSDLGYDKDYSLSPKVEIRPTLNFLDTVRIIDDTHIELKEHVLIDLGALGKGYFVDKIALYLEKEGIKEYLVDGSGDIAYQRNKGVITAGLEDPEDTSKVVGTLELHGKGAFCASSGSRRRWNGYHHTIDPNTLKSPIDVIGTWVEADSAALADALATCLFFAPEGNFRPAHEFTSCIMKNGRSVFTSPGFHAQFF
jgi:thiamine biosynthesis lipoprotein